MRGNRKRDTRPEMGLRRAVHALGGRYLVASVVLPGSRHTADLVFRSARVAVFVDGCFWHGCSDHFKSPRTNQGYWSQKVAKNVDRDRAVDKELEAAGWQVLRIWEHEDPHGAARRVMAAVNERKARA